jgi:hypothetical protein
LTRIKHCAAALAAALTLLFFLPGVGWAETAVRQKDDDQKVDFALGEISISVTTYWNRSQDEEVYSFKLPDVIQKLVEKHIHEEVIRPLSERLKPFHVCFASVPALIFSSSYVYQNDGDRIVYIPGYFEQKRTQFISTFLPSSTTTAV